ncbi:hypothetical protein BASA81_008451 [Batrachochytrium salamandrivorans]|nr:hypothetical protein BASA81_008451 [Batrachochytrium salamandrivorans]
MFYTGGERGASSNSLEFLRHSSSSNSMSPNRPSSALRSRVHHHQRQHQTRPKKTLGAIRSHAKQFRVTLKDTVESLSRSILRICEQNDLNPPSTLTRKWYDGVATADWGGDGGNVDFVQYVWRIVSELNANKEPALFGYDGHEMAPPPATVATGESTESAMGRGLRCLLFAIFYLDRMSNSGFQISSSNVHVAMLGAMYLAHKFSDDAPVRMHRFALLGGVSTAVLRKIEVTICLQIGFEFFISELEFETKSLGQLDKAVRAAASRVAKLQPPTSTETSSGQFGLGGSTPVLGAKRRL